MPPIVSHIALAPHQVGTQNGSTRKHPSFQEGVFRSEGQKLRFRFIGGTSEALKRKLPLRADGSTNTIASVATKAVLMIEALLAAITPAQV
jgi:hypothetical protein